MNVAVAANNILKEFEDNAQYTPEEDDYRAVNMSQVIEVFAEIYHVVDGVDESTYTLIRSGAPTATINPYYTQVTNGANQHQKSSKR